MRDGSRPSTLASRLASHPVVLGLCLVGAFILQTAIFPHLEVFGLKPDLLMVVVACWGLLYGPEEGFLAGLAAGLLQDLTSGGVIGLFALAKALVGLTMGVVQSKIFRESSWVATAAVGVGLLGHEVIVWLSLRALGVPAPAVDLMRVALPGSIYGLVLTPLVYRRLLVYRLSEWNRERETAGGAPATGQR